MNPILTHSLPITVVSVCAVEASLISATAIGMAAPSSQLACTLPYPGSRVGFNAKFLVPFLKHRINLFRVSAFFPFNIETFYCTTVVL